MLPLILTMVLLALQIGLLARDQVLVVHAAREGARAAATEPSTATAHAAVTGSSSLAPGRTTVVARRVGGTPSLIEVTVTYRAPTSVPIVGSLFGDVVMRESTTMRIEE